MFSRRFEREVVVTRHARQRMVDRDVTDALLLRVIEEGTTRYRDARRLWVWIDDPDRDDNLLCAVLVLEDKLIVKTVLHRWELLA